MPFQLPNVFEPSTLWLLGVALVVLFALALLAPRRHRWRPPRDYPYVKRPALFSQGEVALLRALEAAAPHLAVYGKVRLEDLIAARKGATNYSSARGYIRSRHIDFVLCDPKTTGIVCAVELDDKTHRRQASKQIDAFKDRALAEAGVPLLRVVAARHYPVAALAAQLEEAVASKP